MANRDLTNDLKPIGSVFETLFNFGYGSHTLFSNFIAFMLHIVAGKRDQALETLRQYDQTAEIGHREALILTGLLDKPHIGKKRSDYFWELFHLLLGHMKKYNREILSELYMAFAAKDPLGQNFTPSAFSHLITGLSIQLENDFALRNEASEGISICDPACGAGTMLIAMAKEQTFKGNNESYFIGQDIDLDCARMCALNLCFFNLEGHVAHCNTLSMETWAVWRTVRRVSTGGYIVELPYAKWPEEYRRFREPSRT